MQQQQQQEVAAEGWKEVQCFGEGRSLHHPPLPPLIRVRKQSSPHSRGGVCEFWFVFGRRRCRFWRHRVWFLFRAAAALLFCVCVCATVHPNPWMMMYYVGRVENLTVLLARFGVIPIRRLSLNSVLEDRVVSVSLCLSSDCVNVCGICCRPLRVRRRRQLLFLLLRLLLLLWKEEEEEMNQSCARTG